MESMSKLFNEDFFFEKYKPIYNHIEDPNYFEGQTEGNVIGAPMYFQTYGAQLDYVRSQDPRCIWTFVAGDECDGIIRGLHIVNAVAYFIASIPYTSGPQEFIYN